MYSQGQKIPQDAPMGCDPEFSQIFNSFQNQNAAFIGMLNELEVFSNRLLDTSGPQMESVNREPKEMPRPGLVNDFREQVSFYAGHNNKLRGILDKLSKLI